MRNSLNFIFAFALLGAGCEEKHTESSNQSKSSSATAAKSRNRKVESLPNSPRDASFLKCLESVEKEDDINRVADALRKINGKFSIADLESLINNPEDFSLGSKNLAILASYGASMELAKRAPESFLSLSLKAEPANKSAFLGGFELLARTKPQLLEEWVRGNLGMFGGDASSQKKSILASALSSMAYEAPEYACRLMMLSELPIDKKAICQRIAEANPSALNSLIESPGVDESLKNWCLAQMVIESKPSDAGTILKWIQKMKPDQVTTSAVTDFLKGQVQLNQKNAAILAKSLDPRFLLSAMDDGVVKQALLNQDPALCSTVINGIVATSANSEKLKAMVSFASARDPQGTLGWVRDLPQSGIKDEYLKSCYYSIFSSLDPRQGSYVNLMPPKGSPDREIAVKSLGEVMGNGARESSQLVDLVGFSNQLDSSERGLFFSSSLHKATWNAPEAVVETISNPNSGIALDESQRSALFRDAATSWSRRDPEAAALWIVEQPEGDAKNGFVEAMMKQWIAKDAVNASEWLASCPQSKSRNAGIKILIESLRKTDPQRAAEWQSAISN